MDTMSSAEIFHSQALSSKRKVANHIKKRPSRKRKAKSPNLDLYTAEPPKIKKKRYRVIYLANPLYKAKLRSFKDLNNSYNTNIHLQSKESSNIEDLVIACVDSTGYKKNVQNNKKKQVLNLNKLNKCSNENGNIKYNIKIERLNPINPIEKSQNDEGIKYSHEENNNFTFIKDEVPLTKTEKSLITYQKPHDSSVTSIQPQDSIITSREYHDSLVTCLKTQDNSITGPGSQGSSVTCLRPQDSITTSPEHHDSLVTCLKTHDNLFTCPEPQDSLVALSSKRKVANHIKKRPSRKRKANSPNLDLYTAEPPKIKNKRYRITYLANPLYKAKLRSFKDLNNSDNTNIHLQSKESSNIKDLVIACVDSTGYKKNVQNNKKKQVLNLNKLNKCSNENGNIKYNIKIERLNPINPIEKSQNDEGIKYSHEENNNFTFIKEEASICTNSAKNNLTKLAQNFESCVKDKEQNQNKVNQKSRVATSVTLSDDLKPCDVNQCYNTEKKIKLSPKPDLKSVEVPHLGGNIKPKNESESMVNTSKNYGQGSSSNKTIKKEFKFKLRNKRKKTLKALKKEANQMNEQKNNERMLKYIQDITKQNKQPKLRCVSKGQEQRFAKTFLQKNYPNTTWSSYIQEGKQEHVCTMESNESNASEECTYSRPQTSTNVQIESGLLNEPIETEVNPSEILEEILDSPNNGSHSFQEMSLTEPMDSSIACPEPQDSSVSCLEHHNSLITWQEFQDNFIAYSEHQNTSVTYLEPHDSSINCLEPQDSSFTNPELKDNVIISPENQNNSDTYLELWNSSITWPELQDNLISSPGHQKSSATYLEPENSTIAGPELQDNLISIPGHQKSSATYLEPENSSITGPKPQDNLITSCEHQSSSATYLEPDNSSNTWPELKANLNTYPEHQISSVAYIEPQDSLLTCPDPIDVVCNKENNVVNDCDISRKSNQNDPKNFKEYYNDLERERMKILKHHERETQRLYSDFSSRFSWIKIKPSHTLKERFYNPNNGSNSYQKVPLTKTEKSLITYQKPHDSSVTSIQPQDSIITSREYQDSLVTCSKTQDNSITGPGSQGSSVTCLRPQDSITTSPEHHDSLVTCLKTHDNSFTGPEPQDSLVASLESQNGSCISPELNLIASSEHQNSLVTYLEPQDISIVCLEPQNSTITSSKPNGCLVTYKETTCSELQDISNTLSEPQDCSITCPNPVNVIRNKENKAVNGSDSSKKSNPKTFKEYFGELERERVSIFEHHERETQKLYSEFSSRFSWCKTPRKYLKTENN